MSFDEAMELLDRIEQTTVAIYVASVFNSRTQVRLREIQNDVDRLRKLTLAARPSAAGTPPSDLRATSPNA